METATRAPTAPARAASRGGVLAVSHSTAALAALAVLMAAGRLVEAEASVAGPPAAAARPAADLWVEVAALAACRRVAVVAPVSSSWCRRRFRPQEAPWGGRAAQATAARVDGWWCSVS